MGDAAKRCFYCSGLDHKKNECPHREQSTPSTSTGGSGSSGGGKGAGGKSDNGKGDKGSHKTSTASASASTNKGGKTVQGTGKGVGGEVNQDPKVAMVESNAAAGGDESTSQSKGKEDEPTTSSIPTPATGETAMVNEITSLLRSLRTGGPSVRVCSVRKMSGNMGVLIDGGATHCLRTATSTDEWNKSKDTMVTLANGQTMMKMVEGTRTLITQQKVQPIIPMSAVTELGYQVQWTSGKCCIGHPSRPALEVTMVQGCPTMDFEEGMAVMREVEEHFQRRACVRAIIQGVAKGDEGDQRWSELRDLFPHVPLELLEQIPGDRQFNGARLPFNRRRRRQIMNAKRLVVHAFSGPDEKGWLQGESGGTVILCLDQLLGHNLLDNNLAAWIEHLLDTKPIDLWLAGPPCRTVSVCRMRNDDGPRQLRGDGQDRFGLCNLTEKERILVDQDTILWLRNLRWMHLAQVKNPLAEVLLEQPRDPNLWKHDLPEVAPSFLRWPETKSMADRWKWQWIQIDQGALGHETRKPSTFLTTVPEVIQLQGLQSSHNDQQTKWPEEVNQRVQLSKRLASWAPGLKELLKKVIQRLPNGKPSIQALTATEMREFQEWENHIRQGHCPFRRDCAICVESRGRDRQHFRQHQVDSFCLSLDVSGPYKEGIDQVIVKPRYYITGVVTVPCSGENPLVSGLRELGMKVDHQLENVESPLPGSTLSAQQGPYLGALIANSGRGRILMEIN